MKDKNLVNPVIEEAIDNFSIAKNESSEQSAFRKEALNDANSLDLPRFEKINYSRWPLETPLVPEHTTSDLGDLNLSSLGLAMDEPYIVQVGQTTVANNLPKKYIDQGVVVCDIFEAMTRYPDLIERYYMTTAVKSNEDKLTAMHAAFMNGGTFIYVPKNVEVKEPIQAYYYQDSRIAQDYMHHVLVVAEQSASLSYLENLSTIGEEKNMANIVVEVIAKDNSQVKFSAVDNLSAQTTTYLNRRGHLLNDAHIDWALGFMNNGNIIGDFDSDLIGNGSHAEVKVVAISTGKQVQGIDTRVTNYGRNSIGHILQHGVILEKATLTFNGIGHIIKGAKGADAQQESRVLMLSRKARGDANPILLIDENDVQAGHAASVGRVDEQQLYYLMSRGLPKKTAERLVIRGFLGAVLAAIPSKQVQQRLTATIERKLVDGQKSE